MIFARPTGEIPVLLCVDVEPDDHVYPLDNPSPWVGFEQLVNDMPRIRSALQAATEAPVALCWSLRMDPQIALAYGTASYALERFGSFFDEDAAAADAVGVHPHAWRWAPERQVWLADHDDQAWVDECLEVAVATYASAVGALPAYHRFGSGFMSTETMNLVRRLGVPVDMTIEPGEPVLGPGERDGIVWTGSSHGFEDVPRRPYQPDPADFRRAADSPCDNFWAVPLTSGRVRPRSRPTLSYRVRYWGRRPSAAARRALQKMTQSQPRYRPLRMGPDGRSPADFWDAVFDAASDTPRPCLAFAVRSDLLLEPASRAWFHGVIEGLSAEPRRRQLRFTTPERALVMTGRTAGSPDRPASGSIR